MSYYEKSWFRPNLLGQKGKDITRLGYKTAVKVQRLGQKARRFYEMYGRHLPGEWVDKAEPYLSAVEGGAAKAEKALGSALQLKKGSRPHSNVPSRGSKNSGGSASRPSHHGHVKNKQQKKRSARYTGV